MSLKNGECSPPRFRITLLAKSSINHSCPSASVPSNSNAGGSFSDPGVAPIGNRKGGIPCQIFLDEFPSFYAHGIHLTLAQARSNKVAVTLGIQDFGQLRMEYGRDHADAIFNLPANTICGQVSGDSARLVSERFGRILQEKVSLSTNSRDSSTSQSHQLDPAVPASKIASKFAITTNWLKPLTSLPPPRPRPTIPLNA